MRFSQPNSEEKKYLKKIYQDKGINILSEQTIKPASEISAAENVLASVDDAKQWFERGDDIAKEFYKNIDNMIDDAVTVDDIYEVAAKVHSITDSKTAKSLLDAFATKTGFVDFTELVSRFRKGKYTSVADTEN